MTCRRRDWPPPRLRPTHIVAYGAGGEIIAIASLYEQKPAFGAQSAVLPGIIFMILAAAAPSAIALARYQRLTPAAIQPPETGKRRRLKLPGICEGPSGPELTIPACVIGNAC